VSLEEARRMLEAWRVEDSTERSHQAPGQRPPAAMVEELQVTANIYYPDTVSLHHSMERVTG
jgi:hypothetical protein